MPKHRRLAKQRLPDTPEMSRGSRLFGINLGPIDSAINYIGSQASSSTVKNALSSGVFGIAGQTISGLIPSSSSSGTTAPVYYPGPDITVFPQIAYIKGMKVFQYVDGVTGTEITTGDYNKSWGQSEGLNKILGLETRLAGTHYIKPAPSSDLNGNGYKKGMTLIYFFLDSNPQSTDKVVCGIENDWAGAGAKVYGTKTGESVKYYLDASLGADTCSSNGDTPTKFQVVTFYLATVGEIGAKGYIIPAGGSSVVRDTGYATVSSVCKAKEKTFSLTLMMDPNGNPILPSPFKGSPEGSKISRWGIILKSKTSYASGETASPVIILGAGYLQKTIEVCRQRVADPNKFGTTMICEFCYTIPAIYLNSDLLQSVLEGTYADYGFGDPNQSNSQAFQIKSFLTTVNWDPSKSADVKKTMETLISTVCSVSQGYFFSSCRKKCISANSALTGKLDGCSVPMETYCQDNFNSDDCKSYCQLTGTNCDQLAQNYCQGLGDKALDVDACGCFMNSTFYNNYYDSLTKAFPPAVALSRNPDCSFPKCNSSKIHTYNYKLNPDQCPNIDILNCLVKVDFENSGKISGNIGIDQNVTGCSKYLSYTGTTGSAPPSETGETGPAEPVKPEEKKDTLKSSETPKKTTTKKSSTGLLIGIGAGVLVILIIIIIWAIMRGRSKPVT